MDAHATLPAVHQPVKRRADGPVVDRSAAARELSWTDTRLVRECVAGNEAAWTALVDKYKNLIFSIPIKQGLPRDDAADVFQRVCLLLLAELPQLREAKALPMWLIRVTSRECLRWRRQEHPYPARAVADADTAAIADGKPLADEVLARIKDEQALREAMRSLPPRCRQLIEMLFFETPARPYQQIAATLGLAAGSIGFIRGRCLTRLRRELEGLGFR
jgi:RNA polymerase sigma factor (sigma-70 family)